MSAGKRQAAVDEAGGEELVFADGFDDAVVGVADVRGYTVVVYDEELVIKALMANGLDDTEAREYFDFNVARAYVGEQTPIFMRRLSRE